MFGKRLKVGRVASDLGGEEELHIAEWLPGDHTVGEIRRPPDGTGEPEHHWSKGATVLGVIDQRPGLCAEGLDLRFFAELRPNPDEGDPPECQCAGAQAFGLEETPLGDGRDGSIWLPVTAHELRGKYAPLTVPAAKAALAGLGAR